ncbi:pepsin-like aspartic protease [Shewanella waksmanii]|uniref:pepsin-like aspartic protease n=1 Tax=Shewanella waksmanii TaxID=213783 RepID=UPI003736DA0E
MDSAKNSQPQHQISSIKLPLSNVYAKGDFCAQLRIGSQHTPVNLILDTGSSTLAVDVGKYQPDEDTLLTATSYAQEVNYGVGGWDGPVVLTQIGIGSDTNAEKSADASVGNRAETSAITLPQCHVALVANKQQQTSFFDADGILGLGYHHLNKGYDLSRYFNQQNITPALTYPWPFNCSSNTTPDSKQNAAEKQPDSDNLPSFKHFLWQQPEQDIVPYFTELTQHGLVSNKFGFYCQRSSIHVDSPNDSSSLKQLAADPLNQGWLILGEAEQHTELYQGQFKQLKVLHDVYYNVNLVSMQVGAGSAIAAAPLQTQYLNSAFSNAIIDTGASCIAITDALYQALRQQIASCNAKLLPLIDAFKDFSAQDTGIDMQQLDLAAWPDITFHFSGAQSADANQTDTVGITITAQDYWQLNTPKHGKACFKIIGQLADWPNQSIMGLPLMTSYYLVFDRAQAQLGVVKFAQQT